MPDFPEIGCQAIAQYPSSYEIVAPTVIQQYVDGGEQRFATTDAIRRTWVLRLDRLSESDANRVWDFFESVNGRSASFRFKDPWTNAWVEPCWFESDSLAFDHLSDGVFQGELHIYAEEV